MVCKHNKRNPSSIIRFLSWDTAVLSRRSHIRILYLGYLGYSWGKYSLFILRTSKNFETEQVENELKQRLRRQVIMQSAVCLVYEDQVVSICSIHL